MNPIIEKLEEQLRQDADICTTSEGLNKFPPSLRRNRRNTGIGYIVCKKGTFDFAVEGKRCQANEGETVFIPQDKKFRVVKQSKDMEVYILIYHIDQIKDHLGPKVTSMNIYTKLYPPHLYVFPTGKEDNLIKYITLIESTMSENTDAFIKYEQKLLLISLTFKLCSIFQKKMLYINEESARRAEVFLQLIQLIDKYHKSERGVEFYADKLCLSAKYLSKVSKAVSGYPVQELVFKAIIRTIKMYLNVTNMTAKQISEEMHFQNPSSFGTFFRTHVGTSPQKYREMEEEKRLQEMKENNEIQEMQEDDDDIQD